MDLQLLRIDDRLIHGQVVLGWAKFLESRRIILCDDWVAENEWERELYLSCVPADLEARIMSLRETSQYLRDGNEDPGRTIVLMKSPEDVLRLVESGFLPGFVNLGGIHFANNRKRYLPYLYLNDLEVEQLKTLEARGCHIICQDVPTSRKHTLMEILS